MRPSKTGKKKSGRRAWEPPAVTKLPIGSETKSPRKDGKGPPAHPAAPGAPTSKLGLSIEMAFPLSARFGDD